VEVKNEYH
jgi:WbqC-like protein family